MSSVMHPYCQCPFLCHSLIVTVDVIHSKYSDSHPKPINVSLVRKSPKHGTGCRKECLLLYDKLLQGNNHVSVSYLHFPCLMCCVSGVVQHKRCWMFCFVYSIHARTHFMIVQNQLLLFIFTVFFQ